MLPASSALLAILNGTTDYFIADLFTFGLLDGSTQRWTSWDTTLIVGANVFTAGGKNGAPAIERGQVTKSIGLTVGQLDVTLLCGDSVTLEGVPMVLAAHNGAFDNATVKVDRVFMPKPGVTTAGTLPWFYGNVGAADIDSTSIKLDCRDVVDLLDVQMPKNLFLPMCSHLLYDPGCTLTKATFTFNYSMASGASAIAFQASTSTGKPSGYFETGVLAMTSGAAAGARRAVSNFDGTVFTLATALPSAPEVGDTFTVSAGCSREYSICGSRFSNQQHFRGFKDIPPAETAI